MANRHKAENRQEALLFGALGDEKRLWLVNKLCTGGPMSIASLTQGSRVTRQGITKHLRVMEKADLVSSVRSGREVLWQVHPRPLHEAQRYLEHISRQWDTALARLKSLVETD